MVYITCRQHENATADIVGTVTFAILTGWCTFFLGKGGLSWYFTAIGSVNILQVQLKVVLHTKALVSTFSPKKREEVIEISKVCLTVAAG